jgi:hypothetical protein
VHRLGQGGVARPESDSLMSLSAERLLSAWRLSPVRAASEFQLSPASRRHPIKWSRSSSCRAAHRHGCRRVQPNHARYCGYAHAQTRSYELAVVRS